MNGRGAASTAAITALAAALTALTALVLAGCGGGSSGSAVAVPSVAPARVFSIAGFEPGGMIAPGVPTRISFTIRRPDGRPLTTYRTGPGPHTGVHLIIVRDDLAYIIHQHPPVGAGGLLRESVTFPAPGRYRVLVDVYPNIGASQSNFQLVKAVSVTGAYHPRPLAPFRPAESVDGYRFVMAAHPPLHAIQAAFINVTVTDPHGRPVSFAPWFGALAHAIFFRRDSLDYFHTHVCGTGAPNCTSLLGASRIAGTSTAPGRLKLGVLLPVAGTWRLFLQLKEGGRVLTAPFTLTVT